MVVYSTRASLSDDFERTNLVLHGGHYGARVGEQEGARLNFQLQLAAVACSKSFKRVLDGIPHHCQVGGWLAEHAAYLHRKEKKRREEKRGRKR